MQHHSDSGHASGVSDQEDGSGAPHRRADDSASTTDDEGRSPSPARSRSQRPKWTREEENVLVEAHCTLGNAWVAIAECLPGRTAVEVKNIWHSTLRARNLQTRSVLRTYLRALKDRADKPSARQQALRAAQQYMAEHNCGSQKAKQVGRHQGGPSTAILSARKRGRYSKTDAGKEEEKGKAPSNVNPIKSEPVCSGGQNPAAAAGVLAIGGVPSIGPTAPGPVSSHASGHSNYTTTAGAVDYGRSSAVDYGRSSTVDYGRSSAVDYGRSSTVDYGRSSTGGRAYTPPFPAINEAGHTMPYNETQPMEPLRPLPNGPVGILSLTGDDSNVSNRPFYGSGLGPSGSPGLTQPLAPPAMSLDPLSSGAGGGGAGGVGASASTAPGVDQMQEGRMGGDGSARTDWERQASHMYDRASSSLDWCPPGGGAQRRPWAGPGSRPNAPAPTIVMGSNDPGLKRVEGSGSASLCSGPGGRPVGAGAVVTGATLPSLLQLNMARGSGCGDSMYSGWPGQAPSPPPPPLAASYGVCAPPSPQGFYTPTGMAATAAEVVSPMDIAQSSEHDTNYVYSGASGVVSGAEGAVQTLGLGTITDEGAVQTLGLGTITDEGAVQTLGLGTITDEDLLACLRV